MTDSWRVDRQPHAARIGWIAILAGVALALAIQFLEPVGVPLYDGVLVVEPYRYLHPSGGQVGDPTSFSTPIAIAGGVSPVVVAATTENPAQAQLVAQRDAYELPSGATSLLVSIVPVDVPAVAGVQVVGNVYRFTITDQSGLAVRANPCSTCRTLVLRAPDGITEGSIKRLSNGVWSDVSTRHAGVVGMFQANVDALGDYAVTSTGTITDPGFDVTLIVLGGGIVVVVLAFAALLALRGREAPGSPVRARRPGVAGRGAPPRPDSGRPGVPGRIPSKRKGGRRPPSGRSDT